MRENSISIKCKICWMVICSLDWLSTNIHFLNILYNLIIFNTFFNIFSTYLCYILESGINKEKYCIYLNVGLFKLLKEKCIILDLIAYVIYNVIIFSDITKYFNRMTLYWNTFWRYLWDIQIHVLWIFLIFHPLGTRMHNTTLYGSTYL